MYVFPSGLGLYDVKGLSRDYKGGLGYTRGQVVASGPLALGFGSEAVLFLGLGSHEYNSAVIPEASGLQTPTHKHGAPSKV